MSLDDEHELRERVARLIDLDPTTRTVSEVVALVARCIVAERRALAVEFAEKLQEVVRDTLVNWSGE